MSVTVTPFIWESRSRFFRHVPQWLWPVWKRFGNDHWRRGRWKLGSRIMLYRKRHTRQRIRRTIHLCGGEPAVWIALGDDPLCDRHCSRHIPVDAVHKQSVRRHLDVDWSRLHVRRSPSACVLSRLRRSVLFPVLRTSCKQITSH